MEINIATPGLLFPAISLLMLAYTNRFLAISHLIRNLYAKYRENPEKAVFFQINSLHKRLLLIKRMQGLGVFSLLLCVICIFLLFAGELFLGKIVFGIGLLFFIASLIYSLLEIHASIHALNIQLSEMKEFAKQVKEGDLLTKFTKIPFINHEKDEQETNIGGL
jgi:hypothetical protein